MRKNAASRASAGLTLLEILISMLILSLVMVGLTNLFTVCRRYTQHSRSRMSATEVGKYLLSPLQSEVREDTYDNLTSGKLSVRPDWAGDTVTLDGISYNSTFNVSNVTGLPAGGVLRRVNVTISWSEPNV